MAFIKHARAKVVQPVTSLIQWEKSHGSKVNLRTAAKIVLQEYDPKAFMLTHCTIIASVDTMKSPAPLGKSMVDGFEIERKYDDWLVSPKTAKYINNNFDCWERKLLLASFPSFIGGENYVEHIQIPELSKGKIIDAAARDIGDSIYVDILVATERKHRSLIAAITNGTLQTLSMGCSVEFTTCTKCGNVAADETQLCPHVRYMKGSKFKDHASGEERVVAELCGHIKEEPGSVKFIEASWVGNPAFPGAVLRKILSPEEVQGLASKMGTAFSMPARTLEEGMIQKAARMQQPQSYNVLTNLFAAEQEQDPGGMIPPEPAAEPGAMEKAVDDIVDDLREKALSKVREEMSRGEAGRARDENQNTTLIKDALQNPTWRRIAKSILVMSQGDLGISRRILLGMIYLKSGGWGAVKASKVLSGRDILAMVRMFDISKPNRTRIAGENRLYRAVLKVGGTNQFATTQDYLTACGRVVGRALTQSERDTLVRMGRLFSLGS